MENKEWVMPTHIIAGAGIVTNENDEVLMVKTYNAGWVFPGGQVEVGENVIDAVKREIMKCFAYLPIPENILVITESKKCRPKSCLTLYAKQKAEIRDHLTKIRNLHIFQKRRCWN